jgi:hypothetical protein
VRFAGGKDERMSRSNLLIVASVYAVGLGLIALAVYTGKVSEALAWIWKN